MDEALATAPLDRTRWQYGIAVAARAFTEPRSGYGALQVFLGAGLGVVAGAAVNGLPLALQFLVGGLIALGAYWGVPTAWAGVAALDPRSVQRDEARRYARALETYNRDYELWAARREIAYRFRHDTFEDHKRFCAGQSDARLLIGSLSAEEERWRNLLNQAITQIEDNGADLSAFREQHLRALEDPDDSFEGDDHARIRNSMLSACQNLLAETLQLPAPTHPSPPSDPPGPAFQL